MKFDVLPQNAINIRISKCERFDMKFAKAHKYAALG